MAGSQLNQLGLQDLVKSFIDDYLAKAIQIGQNPELAQEYKLHLRAHKNEALIFNSLDMTRYIEKGYQAAIERWRSGLNPEDIYSPK